MFSTQSDNCIPICPYVHIFDIISLFAAEFEGLKIGISGKGVKYYFCQSAGGVLRPIQWQAVV